MRVTVLCTGSKGNCTIIETKNSKVMIDCGMTYKTLLNKALSKGISLNNLDAVLITHEHTDHISSLEQLAKYTKCKIYININSFNYLKEPIKNHLDLDKVIYLTDSVKYHINDLTFVALNAHHDSVNCYSFIFKEDGNSESYCHITDTGCITESYIPLFKEFNTILIESNHDVELLENSSRPLYLIQRILSNNGHLSNVQCSRYLKKIYSSRVKNVILAHLSEECNTKDLAIIEVNKVFDDNIPFNLYVSEQHVPLDTIKIGE